MTREGLAVVLDVAEHSCASTTICKPVPHRVPVLARAADYLNHTAKGLLYSPVVLGQQDAEVSSASVVFYGS